jgi:membrane-associated phospholipid phosphatase
MHVSVSTLTAFHLQQNFSPEIGAYAQLAFLFPILISISALFTKQHYLVDLAPGALFGYLNFEVYQVYAP